MQRNDSPLLPLPTLVSVRIPVPRVVPPELYVMTGLLLGAVLLGACSGPAPSPDATESEPPSRVYHVQLQMTEDKDQAAETLGQAQRWWKQQPDSTRPPLVQGTQTSDTPVNIKWKTPFYRVQLGPFAKEKQAERVLDTALSAFPDAFIVPDQTEAP